MAYSVSLVLEIFADELSILRSPTAHSAGGGDELSGRIAFKDVRSFSDLYGQIVRETFLYLGCAALGGHYQCWLLIFSEKNF